MPGSAGRHNTHCRFPQQHSAVAGTVWNVQVFRSCPRALSVFRSYPESQKNEMAENDINTSRTLSKRRFLWSLYITELILVLLSLVIARFSRGIYLPYTIRLDADGLLLGMAAAVPVALVVLLMMSGPVSRLGWVQNSMDRILKRLRAPFGLSIRSLGAVDIVLLSLAAGLGEELFFRGMLQSFVGVWWAALVFGLLHALTPVYFFMATAIGLYFGYLYEATGNLLIPMVSHATYDIFALVLLQRQFSLQKDATILRE